MNIVFLDFDGVINNDRILSIETCHIDTFCLDMIAEALKTIDAKVVVSSSWRGRGINFIKTKFDEVNRGNFIKEFFHTDWCTKQFRDKDRGYEVEEWITRHSKVENIEKYVCIDDDSDFLDNQILIKTNRIFGFSYVDKLMLLSIFGRTTRQEVKFLLEEIAEEESVIRNKRKNFEENIWTRLEN